MSTARESRMHDNRLRAQVSGTLERTDGAVLRWWRSGRGEPLVLVHGSFDDHNGWTPVLPMLTQHADVISYDRRGHSLSTSPRGRVGVQADAEDLLALIDKVAGGPVHLVGHGYGGSVAMLAATMRREAVRSLAVHEPPLFELLHDNPIAKVLFAEYSVWLGQARRLRAPGAGTQPRGARAPVVRAVARQPDRQGAVRGVLGMARARRGPDPWRGLRGRRPGVRGEDRLRQGRVAPTVRPGAPGHDDLQRHGVAGPAPRPGQLRRGHHHAGVGAFPADPAGRGGKPATAPDGRRRAGRAAAVPPHSPASRRGPRRAHDASGRLRHGRHRPLA